MTLQKNKALLFFTLLLLSFPALSQRKDEYKAGYIVSHSYDTLYGYFYSNLKIGTEQTITFKPDLEERAKERFMAKDYVSMDLGEEHYLSISVQNPGRMEKVIVMAPRYMNGFYEVYLYYYWVNNAYPREDFYIKGPSYFEQLAKKKPELKKQLLHLFADDEFVLSEMERIGVSYDNAMMFFKVYNKRKAKTPTID